MTSPASPKLVRRFRSRWIQRGCRAGLDGARQSSSSPGRTGVGPCPRSRHREASIERAAPRGRHREASTERAASRGQHREGGIERAAPRGRHREARAGRAALGERCRVGGTGRRPGKERPNDGSSSPAPARGPAGNMVKLSTGGPSGSRGNRLPAGSRPAPRSGRVRRRRVGRLAGPAILRALRSTMPLRRLAGSCVLR